eukprot:XP_001709665.1 Hypothetical protein GL50803_20916 [Giardia lamblia ATCC 50803]
MLFINYKERACSWPASRIGLGPYRTGSTALFPPTYSSISSLETARERLRLCGRRATATWSLSTYWPQPSMQWSTARATHLLCLRRPETTTRYVRYWLPLRLATHFQMAGLPLC